MDRGSKILLTQTPVLARTGLINLINPIDYEIKRIAILTLTLNLANTVVFVYHKR